MIPAWMSEANCIGTDPEAWFPGKGGRVSPMQRKICDACPVQACCLAYALREPYLRGIWGGLTESQRKQLIRTKTTLTLDLNSCSN